MILMLMHHQTREITSKKVHFVASLVSCFVSNPVLYFLCPLNLIQLKRRDDTILVLIEAVCSVIHVLSSC